METLKTLIANLAFILLLATFLEMLLPNSSLRGFVRLVMGIFVIAAVLQPLAGLLQLSTEDYFQAWMQNGSSQTEAVLPEGQSDAPGKSAVREQYRKILKSQIKMVAESFDTVVSADVQIELGPEGDGYLDYPPILKISVNLYKTAVSGGAVDSSAAEIETIVIGEETGDTGGSGAGSGADGAGGSSDVSGSSGAGGVSGAGNTSETSGAKEEGNKEKKETLTLLELQVRDKIAQALQVNSDLIEVHEK